MAYAPHALLILAGTLGTTGEEEIWQCGIRGTLTESTGAEEAWMLSHSVALQTWFSAVATRMRNDANLTTLKLNRIGSNGKYVDPSTSHIRSVGPVAGNAAPMAPDIINLAYSWKSGKSRGPGSNGRIYPPNVPTADSVATHKLKVTAPDRTAHLAAAVALFNILITVNTDLLAFTPVIASKVNATNTQITRVRVGDVVDVQRRRKNAVRETYAQTVVVT